MGYLSQGLSVVGGRRVIVGLGGLYVAVAGVFGSVLLFESTSLTEVVGRTFLLGCRRVNCVVAHGNHLDVLVRGGVMSEAIE